MPADPRIFRTVVRKQGGDGVHTYRMTPEETGQLVLVKGTNDGATWSKSVSITPQIKDPAWRL